MQAIDEPLYILFVISRFLHDPNSIGEAIQVIWSDISKELMARDKIDFAKAAILKISSNSFVLTSDGRVRNSDFLK